MKKNLFLFILISVCVSLLASEAEQFFSEANRLYKQEKTTAWEKLNTAIALEPKNLIFRSRKLDWQYRELPYKASLTAYLEILEKMYKVDIARQRSMEFIRRKLQLGRLERAWNKSSKKDQKKLAAFCDKFRATRTKEYEIRLKMNKPSRSLRDLRNKDEHFFCWRHEFPHFYDIDKFKAEVLAGALEYLRRTDSFFRNPPKGIKYSRDPEEWIRSNLNLNWYTWKDGRYRGIIIIYTPDELEEYICTAKKHSLKGVRAIGLLLELYNKTIRNNYDPTIFEKDVKTFALAFAKLKLIPKKPYYRIKSLFWNNHLNKHPKLIAIANRVGKKIIPLWCKTPYELFNLEIRNLPNGYADLPQFILNNRKLILTFKNFNFQRMANILLNRIIGRNDLKAREALDFINMKMKIELIASYKNTDSPISNAILHGKELLYPYADKGKLNIDVMDMTNFKTRRLYSYPTKLKGWCRIYRNSFSDGHALDCDGKLLAVGAKDAIHLFRLDGSKAWTITDLPDSYVNAVAILGGRIYAWLGYHSSLKKGSRGRMLFSCNLQGKDRRQHYNGRRTEKNTIKVERSSDLDFSSFPRRCRGMLAGHQRKKLYFLNDNGIGIYNPATNSYKAIELKPKYSGESWEMKTFQSMDDGKLYISFGMDCVIYYMDSGKYEWVFSGTQSGNGRAKYTCWNGFNILGPFYVRKGQLWSAYSGFVNTALPKPEKYFFLPPFERYRNNINMVYPCPDGKSVVYLRGRDFLKLTPQENVK